MKLLAMICLLVVACSAPLAGAAVSDSPEEFIQGSWRAEGTDPSGRHSWYQEWTFDHGKFKHTAYPPINQTGSYRIVKTAGNRLTLELYDQQGTFGTENSQIEVVLNRKRLKLTIKGQGPFKRVSPNS
jgi:hypothetical protein